MLRQAGFNSYKEAANHFGVADTLVKQWCSNVSYNVPPEWAWRELFSCRQLIEEAVADEIYMYPNPALTDWKKYRVDNIKRPLALNAQFTAGAQLLYLTKFSRR